MTIGQILMMLVQLGVCQPAMLQDSDGKQVAALVCNPHPAATPPHATPAPEGPGA